jgi:hypothetical protein
MDDAFSLLLFRTMQNLVKPFYCVVRKHPWIIVDVGKCAKTYS